MKRGSIIMLVLLATSCSGIDKHAGDTFYPLGNPNAPDAQSEVARRIRGQPVSSVPIEAETGDIWPGQPEAVPTLQDASHADSHFTQEWHRSLYGLNRDLSRQLADGQAVTAGESVGQRYGAGKQIMMVDKPLPSHVHDSAAPYIGPVNRGIVSIPNGDGTATLIYPHGEVKVVRSFHHAEQAPLAADVTVKSKPPEPHNTEETAHTHTEKTRAPKHHAAVRRAPEHHVEPKALEPHKVKVTKKTTERHLSSDQTKHHKKTPSHVVAQKKPVHHKHRVDPNLQIDW